MPLKIIFFYLLASICCANQFVADLADKPGYNTGTMVVEAGVCGVASWGGKALFDGSDRPDLDFVPAVAISAGGLLLHSVFLRDGASNAGAALSEQLWESGGAFAPVVLNF